jgi:hypothetical protein
VAVAIASDGLSLSDVLAAAITLTGSVEDGLVLAEELLKYRAYSVEATDGLTLSEALTAALSLSPVATDGLTLADASRVRLPYLYKPGHRKGAYTLGRLHGKHELGTIQKGYGLGG